MAAVLLTSCGGSSPTAVAPEATLPPVILRAGNFDALVLASTRPCLVDFYLPNCPHCQTMAPIVARLATDFEGRALVGTVNAAEENPLAQSHGVTAVPTFVFFKDGREVFRQLGATTYADLAARLNALVSAPS